MTPFIKFLYKKFPLVVAGVYRYRYLLRDYGQIDPREFYLFDDRKLIYLVVPKVACTSIKTSIGMAYGITSPEYSLKIHEHPGWQRKIGMLSTVYQDYHKFTFVRNPFDRLVSCYRDKVIFSDPDEIYPKPYFELDYFFPICANISFAEFVESITEIPDRLADRHFKSQHATLYHKGKLLVDYIGKFENLNEDWKALAQKYNFPTQLEHQHTTHTKTGTHKDYRAYYTKKLVQMVYKRYQADVELFGYQDDYRELMNYVCQHEEKRE